MTSRKGASENHGLGLIACALEGPCIDRVWEPEGRGCGGGGGLLWRRQEAPSGTCKNGLETAGRRTRRAAMPDVAACRPAGGSRDTIAFVAPLPPTKRAILPVNSPTDIDYPRPD